MARMTPVTTNNWLFIPYEGSPNARLVIVVDGVPHRAYYDKTIEGGSVRSWAAIPYRSRKRASIELKVDGSTVGTWNVGKR